MILEVKDVVKEFRRGAVRALAGVSFSVPQESCLGIVGESGSGKTTLAKILLKLIPATSGELRYDERLITEFRKDVQIVFQNPYTSLDPKMRVLETLAEPLSIHRIVGRRQLRERAAALLEQVGMEPDALKRYPREFSGGQRQRICIARALASEPKLLVCDEPISSLDLTIQAQMLELLMRLKEKFSLTYLFISHNLAVVRHLADRVIVMERGRIVEQGERDQVFLRPRHAYTRMLLAAAGATQDV